MKSLFSPIMDTDSGTNNTPTDSCVDDHFPLTCNLEKYDFSNREMGSNTGTGEFILYWVLYFSRQLFFSADISRVLIVMFKL